METDTGVTCPECDGRLRTAGTETACEECGLVLDEQQIDRGPEWRSFTDDETDRKRTGAPLTRSRHDRGLSTKIGFSSGSRLTGRKRRQLARLRREHRRATIRSKAERNQVYGFTGIRLIVSHLSLPLFIRDQACVLFRSAQQENLLRGRSLEGFSAASVYATCRAHSITRTIDEITTVSRADRDELKAAYKALNRELGLPTGPIQPTEYLPRYASKLEVDAKVERLAHRYADILIESGAIGGRNPSGVAAACLYAAADEVRECEPITQVAAADAADVSPVTIRSTVRELQSLPLPAGSQR